MVQKRKVGQDIVPKVENVQMSNVGNIFRLADQYLYVYSCMSHHPKGRHFFTSSQHTFVFCLGLGHLSKIILAKIFSTYEFIRVLTLTSQRVISQKLRWHTVAINVWDTRKMDRCQHLSQFRAKFLMRKLRFITHLTDKHFVKNWP